MDFFDILSHAPVIQILNKRLSTRDILSLTRVCWWSYYKWALMSCYEVGFDLAQRVYKRKGKLKEFLFCKSCERIVIRRVINIDEHNDL